MATKNWIQYGKNQWKNKKGDIIGIVIYKTDVAVELIDRIGEFILLKTFKYNNMKKAEYEALVYSKSYMRTH